jgi:hypothetical protein
MRICVTIVMLSAALALAGCGGPDEPEEEEPPMKVEDSAFGDLVGTQDKARDGANAAVDQHREQLKERLEEDEGT